MRIGKPILFAALFGLFVGLAYLGLKYAKRHVTQADVAIYGPILMADGIGRNTAELARVLMKRHKVQILSRHIDKTDMPGELREILKIKYKKPARVTIVEESLWAPGDTFDRFFSDVAQRDQIRFAYSMLESTRIIPEWVMMINLYFDAVIVPDPFLVEAYQKSGVTVPVFFIPIGLDLTDFLKAPLKEPKVSEPFIFAALGTGIERKNHTMMIRAFAKALGNNENAWLYINCRAAEPDVRKEILEEIKNQKCHNIKYTEARLRKDAYLKFFRNVDCLLSFSKGEGYSIQPREAMALGIPVIATDNTGQSTVCKSGLVRAISSDLSEPCYYFGRSISDGEQFNCNLDEAALAIEDVYLHYAQHLAKGPRMREWASQYDFKQLEPYYHTLVAPQNVVLGDVNEVTPERITTNSQVLYEKYKALKNN